MALGFIRIIPGGSPCVGRLLSSSSLGFLFGAELSSQEVDPRLETLKGEALELVGARAKMVQEIIDMLFSFGELGMQEFETQRYLTGILEDNGFEIELGVAGMPSAWTARWGSGSPVVALGSDVDGIPQSNQKPGVGYREAIVSMAPGHGEGHNSGQAVNIVGALAVKEIMEREDIPGNDLDLARHRRGATGLQGVFREGGGLRGGRRESLLPRQLELRHDLGARARGTR